MLGSKSNHCKERPHTAAKVAPAGCKDRKSMHGNEDPEQPIDKQETKYIFFKKGMELLQ